MEKLDNFKQNLLLKKEMQEIHGGKIRKTTNEELCENGHYHIISTDIHHDNDNDGKWSKGDSYEIVLTQ